MNTIKDIKKLHNILDTMTQAVADTKYGIISRKECYFAIPLDLYMTSEHDDTQLQINRYFATRKKNGLKNI